MKTRLQVLSEEERSRVHEESLDILQHAGVRVQTPLGRQILKDAGALVDESSEVVQFPKRIGNSVRPGPAGRLGLEDAMTP